MLPREDCTYCERYIESSPDFPIYRLCEYCLHWVFRCKLSNSCHLQKYPDHKAHLLYLRSRRLSLGLKPAIKPKTVFITINPDSKNIELHAFIRRMHRTAERPMFESVEYCFEQRGTLDSELGKGFHCHMVAILRKGVRPHDCRRLLHQTFVNSKNPMCGHKKHVRVDYLKTDADKLKVTEYIHGIKEDAKISKVKADDVWREENKLEQTYLKE